MAEFSKEYLEAIGSTMLPDFSYIDELNQNPNEIEGFRICEGFGSIGAKWISEEPYLVFLNSEPISLSKAIEKVK